MANDIELMKKQVRENIQCIIDDNKLDEAKNLIDEYLKIDSEDIEIFSMKAVVCIMQGNMKEAEKILEHAIDIDNDSFDLNFNLAYVYEIKGEFQKAIKYYAYAYQKTINEQLKAEVKGLVDNILHHTGRKESFDEILRQNVYKKKCLIICHFYSVFVKDFISNMKKYKCVEFDVLTMDLSYIKDKESNLINNVYIYSTINEIVDKLNRVQRYDVTHIHFLEPFYSSVWQNIKEKSKKLIVSVWGSDYYRMSDENRKIQKYVLDNSDFITMANESTIKEFEEFYKFKYSSKLKVCRFGLTPLEYINLYVNEDFAKIRMELGIPVESLVVTCGYNASPAQNHLEIIDSIIKVKDRLPNNLFLIFPMTYGDDNYRNNVINEIRKIGFKYKVLDKFLSNEDVAKLRIISDIMVQVQTTDQLSGSMQEYLYCNNIVITGEWLPYDVFDHQGIHMLKVTELNQIGGRIVYAIDNFDGIKTKIKNNKKIIWNLSSWESVIDQWTNIY